MSEPVRVQLRRLKGWRMPPNTLKVDRSTGFGNPHRIGDDLILFGGDPPVQVLRNITAAQAVEAFRRDAEKHRDAIVRRFSGKNLACWCRLDAPCHADVLLEIANRERQAEAPQEPSPSPSTSNHRRRG